MTNTAMVMVDHFPEALDKLKNDLEQKNSDCLRIIEVDSCKQALTLPGRIVKSW
jgi:hypothetical protein